MTRRRKPQAHHVCLAKGCGAPIPRWKRLCDRCFKALPWDRRRALADAPPHLVHDRALEASAWLAERGPAALAARVMGEKADG